MLNGRSKQEIKIKTNKIEVNNKGHYILFDIANEDSYKLGFTLHTLSHFVVFSSLHSNGGGVLFIQVGTFSL